MPRKIKLNCGRIAIVDSADYARLKKYNWISVRGGSKTKCGTAYPYYASCSLGKRKQMLMHRMILDLPPSRPIVDHKDGNPLNNQRSNLRVCSWSQNLANQRPQWRKKSSKYKGVGWHKKYEIWRAYIRINKRSHHLGHFKTQKAAAKAYNKAAIEAWGEFALINNV